MSLSNEERRRAERFAHRTYGTASTPDTCYSAHFLNISKTGALIAIIEPHQLSAGDHVQLAADDTTLSVDAEVAHVKSHYIGVRYKTLSEEEVEQVQLLINQAKSD